MARHRWSQAAALLAMIVLTLAAYWTGRLARADQLFRTNSLESVTGAARLAPGNAQYFVLLAEHLQAEGEDPEAGARRQRRGSIPSIPRCRSAAACWPSSKATSARRRSSSSSRQPRVDEALRPPRNACQLLLPPQQLRAILALTSRRAQDRLRRPGAVVPALLAHEWRSGNRPVLRALPPVPESPGSDPTCPSCSRRTGWMPPSRSRSNLRSAATSEDGGALLDFIDRHLSPPDHAPSLVSAWNSLCVRRVIPFSPIALSRPITNGDFRVAPMSRGFDWRVPQSPDINAVRLGQRALRIDLSGKQAEQCELLAQFVPARGRKKLPLQLHLSDCVFSRRIRIAVAHTCGGYSFAIERRLETRGADVLHARRRARALSGARIQPRCGHVASGGVDHAFATSRWSALPEILLGCSPGRSALRWCADAMGPIPMGHGPLPGRRLHARDLLGGALRLPALPFERKHSPGSAIRRAGVGPRAVGLRTNRLPPGDLGFSSAMGREPHAVFSRPPDLLRRGGARAISPHDSLLRSGGECARLHSNVHFEGTHLLALSHRIQRVRSRPLRVPYPIRRIHRADSASGRGRRAGGSPEGCFPTPPSPRPCTRRSSLARRAPERCWSRPKSLRSFCSLCAAAGCLDATWRSRSAW